MQFTTATAVALASVLLSGAGVLAAPLSQFAAAEWTIQSLSRACAEDGSSCTWSFGIATGAAADPVTPCEYVVSATPAAPATQANGGPAACGVYTVTSGWSDQFGADHAFTTLSVVDYGRGLIVYPAYTDAQVASGAVVEPDLSFPVQNLP